MFSFLCPFLVFVISHLGFDGGNLVLIAPVPAQCFPFTFYVIHVREINKIYYFSIKSYVDGIYKNHTLLRRV